MANNFSDKDGRNWVVTLNVHSIKSIKQELGLDLLDEKVHETLQKLAEDLVLAIDVLYLALKDKLDTADISDVEFGRSLSGDCLNEAVGALVQALVDFFPNPRKREWVKKLWDKSTAHMDKANDEMLSNLDDKRLEPHLEKSFLEAREAGIQDAISGMKSIVSPDSSESTQDPSHIAS